MEKIAISNDEIYALMNKLSVRIDISGSSIGSGFLIGTEGVVLTCAHVAKHCTEQSRVYWNDEYYLITSSEYPNSHTDLAILYTDIPNSDFTLIGEDRIVAKYLYAFGFTKDYPLGEPITLEYEGYASGVYSVKNGLIKPGMSGAAVLDISTNVICGVIRRTKDPNNALGGRIIPLNHREIAAFNNAFFFQKSMSTEWSDYLMQWQKETFHSFWMKFKKKKDIETELLESIAGYKEKLFSEYVSGSKSIRIHDLFYHDLMLEFVAVDEFHNIINDIRSLIVSKISKQKGVVICSNPGCGKTTLNYALFHELLNLRLAGSSLLIPILIDLSTQEVDGFPLFGTTEWFKEYLKVYYLLPSELINYMLAHCKMVLIFESIDEYLSRFTFSEIRELFDKKLFQVGINVFSCRTNNYNGYFKSIRIINQLDNYELIRFSNDKIVAYINQFFDLLALSKDSMQQTIYSMLINSSNLFELASTPLHLNMLLDLLLKNSIPETGILDIRTLYELFISEWLNAEDTKYYSQKYVFDVDELFKLLEEISWEFFEESQLGREEYISFTKEKLKNFLAQKYSEEDIEVISLKLIRSTFLVESRRFNRSNLRFIHKSIQEYFVSSYIFRMMVENSTQLGKLMQIYITSPIISEFLRQYLQEINSDSGLKKQIADNCIKAYRQNQCTPEDSNMMRKRIAREQLAYHMGIIRCKELNNFLIDMSTKEEDVWVKRGIIFGLAYSGLPDYQEHYVKLLRDELTSGISSNENDCNIGYSLSFFGDQPFDPQHPDFDFRGNNCANMITRMQYLLNSESDFPGWRLHLYTLVYVYNNRENLKKDFVQCMKEHSYSYRKILDKIKKDNRCSSWPEVSELDLILNEIESLGK